jgi:phospholipid/cholesterol/gamma-HCH transport system permease protein
MTAPFISLDPASHGVRLGGDWRTPALQVLEPELDRLPELPEQLVVDAAQIENLDTGGTWFLIRLLDALEQRGSQVSLKGLDEEQSGLLRIVRERLAEGGALEPDRHRGLLERLGRYTVEKIKTAYSLLAFMGEVAISLGRTVLDPRRLRIRAILATVEQSGVYALPIITLMSFLIGVVVAYQGGPYLQSYGLNIFIVESVTLGTFREMAPMMAAIIVAGRTGSAYAAEIGTMKVHEEIDALRTLGLTPQELLVLPRVLGLMMAMPLLTMVADMAGVFGGMMVARFQLDVDFRTFVDRMHEVIPLWSFLVGIIKAPVFAAIIGIVGCFQGFEVRGGAEAVGQKTTVAVVQSIFLVILADAVFAILFTKLDI